MKKIFCLIIFVWAFVLLLIPAKVSARDINSVTDWYIQDFSSEIILKTDSSALVTEKITADCGNLPNKHGIFRVLPTFYKTEEGKIQTPVKLLSITDFNDQPIPYKETRNSSPGTITWKIGDADKTVTGINNYKIKYIVKNVVRYGNPQFDEFYWNLNGNFWDIETDSFTAKIVLPEELTDKNIESWIYGPQNQKLDYRMQENAIVVKYSQTLKIQEGITTSITIPKNIFTPYEPSFTEKFGFLFWFLIPLAALIFAFVIWLKYGRDSSKIGSIVPEFEIPDKLSPLEMGVFLSQGSLVHKYISAEIVHLAVGKIIKIEELPKTGIFGKKDYSLTLLQKDLAGLTLSEKKLIESLFAGKEIVKLSEVKDYFASEISGIQSQIKETLIGNGLFSKKGFGWQTALITLGIILLIAAFFIIPGYQNWLAVLVFGLSGFILLVFGCLMPQKTPKGAELHREIKGFKLYMMTAEKYRQQFNDKEGIFERFLPYAMMFGITTVWLKKIKEIYGEKYFENYHPYWFVGPGVTNFDFNSFNSGISSLEQSVSQNAAVSSSGSSGGGFSGGGGGGGGGGGW